VGNPLANFARQLPGVLGSVAGLRWNTEEPLYSHARLTRTVEIRRYGSRIAAQTTVFDEVDPSAALSAGFRRLAGYIFGANHRSAKIAMTAPVSQHAGERIAMTAPVTQQTVERGSVVRFFMPAEYTMDMLPTPNDDTVALVTVPAETVAVLRFTGDRGPDAVASHSTTLLEILEDNGFKPAGTPVAWFYDPPWTIPFRRRNEVAVAVTPL
jgi:hypothetical protein